MTRRPRPLDGMLLAAAAVVAVLMVLLATGQGPFHHGRSAGRAVSGGAPVRVVFVHGYSPAACAGVDAGHYWRGFERFFRTVGHEPLSDMTIVTFYRCDTNGTDIAGKPGYSQDTPIETLARRLAWFVHDTYTRQREPVALVGHSVGGLMIRAALQHVQAHDPRYPASLLVPRVVTISSPFGGYVWPGCTSVQCREFAPGSSFLAALDANPRPQGSAGTRWTAIGANGCDPISAASATHVAGTAIVYTKPCYSHTGYLDDRSNTADAVATGPARGRHVIAEVWAALHA